VSIIIRPSQQHPLWHAAFVMIWSATVKLPVAIKQVLSVSRVVYDNFNSCKPIE
jgi:hypothetical protein